MLPYTLLRGNRCLAFRPRLEALEDRFLPAFILFGGNALKETFDDVSSQAFNGTTLDDVGYLNGVSTGMAVFHHDIQGDAFISFGGDTTPTTEPPGQKMQDLFMEGGTDTITIHPYMPVGAAVAEVDEVSLDVKSFDSVPVTIVGQKGTETLLAAPSGSPAGSAFTAVAAANTDTGKDAGGNSVQIGPITQVIVGNNSFVELDNIHAVVFFPGISGLPPTARDDVYLLPRGAMPGQTFQSRDIALTSTAPGSVLDNDSSSMGRQLTARPVTQPGHGKLVWAQNDDGAFTYTPDSTFLGTDSFTYVANDGTSDSTPAVVTIVTDGSLEDSNGDGIPDYIEALAPPNKDGVYGEPTDEGTPDYLKPNVSSVIAADGHYWTLVTSIGSFVNVSAMPAPASPPLPGGVTLTTGVFGFQVTGLAAGDAPVVTLTPDSGLVPTGANGFYVLNSNPSGWSAFNLDTGSGIGAVVTGTEITLHLAASATGVITFRGGPTEIQLAAYSGKTSFVHQAGDLTVKLLTGRVTGTAPPGDPVTFEKVAGSEVGGTVDLNPDGSFIWHGVDPNGSFQFRVTDIGGASSQPAFETIQIQDSTPEIIQFNTDPPDQTPEILCDPMHPNVYQYSPDQNNSESDFDGSGNLSLTGGIAADVKAALTPGVQTITLDQIGVYYDVLVLDAQQDLRRATDLGFTNLSIIVVQPPIRAEDFTMKKDGTFTYLPIQGFFGRDKFLFKVNDGYLDSNTAEVDIIVEHVPDVPAPTAADPYPATPFYHADLQLSPSANLSRVELSTPNQNLNIATFQAVPDPSPAGDYPPGGYTAASFPFGFFKFSVTGLTAGQGALLELSFPPNAGTPLHYFKFGPTPDNPTDHWYDFRYDPLIGLGALFPGQSDPVTGEIVPDGYIYLRFQDGNRGDDDLTANGMISDAGAPVIVTTPAQPEARFVTAVYLSFLNRAPEPGGLSYWTGQMDKGLTRQQIVDDIYGSPEHRGQQVDQFYAIYLRRAADPLGRAFWVSTLSSGVSERNVELGFLTSPEYLQDHPGPTAFITAIYNDLLGRVTDAPGLAHWLALDTLPQWQLVVARAIMTSMEGDQHLIDAAFPLYLHRQPDPQGYNGWLAFLQSEPDNAAALPLRIVGSDEFFNRAEAGIL